MARFRRRRKYNGVWFPTDQDSDWFTLGIPNDGLNSGAYTLGLVPDIPYDQQTTSFGLPAVVGTLGLVPGGLTLALGTDYILNRIVGKLFVSFIPDNQTNISSALVKAGIFIDRVNANGADANSLGGLADAWGMFNESSVQKRWLWRRSWQLSNTAYSNPLQGGIFPVSNVYCGSAIDGPNLDCKAKARVTYQERLFLRVEAKANWFAGFPEESADGALNFVPDIRILAKPVRRNNR